MSSSSSEDLDYDPSQVSDSNEIEIDSVNEVNGNDFESNSNVESDAEFTDNDNNNKTSNSSNKPTIKRSKAMPQKRKEKRSRFLDTEAEVGDETDEEEENGVDSFLEDFIADSEEEEEAAAAAALELGQVGRKRMIARGTSVADFNFDAEAEEQRLKALYGRQSRSVQENAFSTSSPLTSTIPRPFLLPTVTDPKLWLCRAQQGRERSASLALLRVIMERQYSVQPLQIFSIITRDGLKGYVYIEAHKPIHVAQAIEVAKLNHCLYPGQAGKSLVLVPLAEMPQVLQTTAATGNAVSSTTCTEIPEIGTWCRVKRGRYSNDLAQVVDNSQDEGSYDPSNLNTCIIRLKIMPRLNFINSASSPSARIPPRLFDPEEASRYGPVSKSRGFWIYGGETYRDGFLFKNIRLSSLNCTAVTPTLEELARFPDVELNENSFAGASLLNSLHEVSLAPGDQVVIVEGEMKNLCASVDSLESRPNTATGRPEQFAHLIADESSGLSGESARLLLKVTHLRKIFAVGAQVRLLSGPHSDESGIVVAIEANTKNLVIFASGSNQQFIVPADICALAQSNGNDLSRAIKPRTEARASSQTASSNEFALDDLVQFEVEIGGEEGVGVIVRILDTENSVAVFDSLGQVRTIPCRSIKLLANFIENSTGHGAFSTSDTQFKQGDRVTEQQGQGNHKASSFYKVLHTYKSMAFLRPLSGAIPSGSAAITVLPLESILKPRPVPAFRSNNFSVGNAHAPPIGHLLGKSVSITGGPQKGYVGFVKQVADNIARVELHTNGKIISVSVDKLALVGAQNNNSKDYRSNINNNNSSSNGFANTRDRDPQIHTRTPAWNSSGSAAKTPAWNSSGGSKTPGWNSASNSARTPGWNPSASASSARTPAWNSSSSRTPAWNGTSASGAKTPSWSTTTGMTPAWNVPTALGQSNVAANWQKGTTSAWNSAASRTPAWSRGSDRIEESNDSIHKDLEKEKKPWEQFDNVKRD